MQQQFYINQNSVLPILKMELINDGRNDFKKFYDIVKNCSITFTMTNMDTNVIKIANAEAFIAKKENEGCVEQYLICYEWKPRDTKEKGVFEGVFTLHFDGTLTSETTEYPKGDLIMPIREKLVIIIQ